MKVTFAYLIFPEAGGFERVIELKEVRKVEPDTDLSQLTEDVREDILKITPEAKYIRLINFENL